MGKGYVFNKILLGRHKVQATRYKKVVLSEEYLCFARCILVSCTKFLDFLQRSLHLFNLIRFNHISYFIIAKVFNR